jgi:hypothetical protein
VRSSGYRYQCISHAFSFGYAPVSLSTTSTVRREAHLAVFHHGIFDKHHHPPLLLLSHSIVLLITRSDCELAPIRTEGKRRDRCGVLGVQLHPLLGGMVPDGDEAV